jgi:2-dehydro-3-deoxyphosphogluconate aldolase/(4S)-4-hydroxy-2-oxoglutarate aldolase
MSEPDGAVTARLGRVRVLPVATIDDAGEAPEIARALQRGGVGCIEIAFRSDAAAEAIRQARGVDGMLVGAGTVLSPEQADAAVAAGAQFAVSPGLNETVVGRCRELALPFFPGVASPTEIERARGLGLLTLKLFPAATVGGIAFLNAVAPTYPDVRFIPTGGVSSDNLAAYLRLPSVLACGGTWLVDRALLRDRRYDEVERLAREAVRYAQ